MGRDVTSPERIAGVTTTELREIADQRGSVLHMMRSDTRDFVRFGECYFSEIVPGAIKAWKRHAAQTQHIAVPVGRIRLVIYDERETSQTNGVVQVFELGRPDAYLRVRIPPGLWYGFACLESRPALIANCTDIPHDSADSVVRPIDDPSIPYVWPP